LISDKVTDKNKLAPFYGPRCIVVYNGLKRPNGCQRKLSDSQLHLTLLYIESTNSLAGFQL